ncbi:MAG: hypothetical protein ACLT9P_01265 [Evtepia gabavorous]
MAEGCEVMTLAAPVRIEADERRRWHRPLWVQPQVIGDVDSSRRPKPNKADIWTGCASADIIVVAIGAGHREIRALTQAACPSPAATAGDACPVRSTTWTTSLPAATASPAPPPCIRAIAAGKVAAANIDEYSGFRHRSDDPGHARRSLRPADNRRPTSCRPHRATGLLSGSATLRTSSAVSTRRAPSPRPPRVLSRCDHFG